VTDPRQQAIVLMTERIRELVRSVSVDIRGPALAYELAASIAETVRTPDEADTLLDQLRDQMAEQLEHFGVGHPHP
jgi:hypothetical protein